MYFGGAAKLCGGDGCTTPVSITDELCGDCAMKAAREAAVLRLYVTDGLARLEAYLGRWAEFEAAYGPN